MTAPVEGAASPPRRCGRAGWIALILSLLLNVFFVGGLVYSRFAAEPPPSPQQRFLMMAGELNLSADQRKDLRDVARVIRQKSQDLRQTNQPLIKEILEELEKPQPDRDKLSALFAKVSDNRQKFQADIGAVMLAYLETLTQDQRKEFVERSRRRQESLGNRMKRWMER